jgi:CelD/BcsL family acetyltransferase involved in cellulose biosynthesis
MDAGMKVGHVPIQSDAPSGAAAAPAAARDDGLARLERGCAEPNPFYGPALLDTACTVLDPDADVRLVDAIDDRGVIIGRLPVTQSREHGRFPLRNTTNWLHRHCFYGAPLLLAGREDEAWRTILTSLDAAPWSGTFLHLRNVDAEGPVVAALKRICAAKGRRCEEVGRYERALLASDKDAETYWMDNVRSKKRKELRRLQSRLAELGAIERRHLADAAELPHWIDAFLLLEAKGWKGEQGTALGSRAEDSAFLRQACARAFEAGQLDLLRIDCAGQPIAMLINFVSTTGGFSFKIAIDPEFARYSPGVLIEQDNLARVLDAKVAPWMDSCAAPDHPMIDSLWGERRIIAQYRIGLHKPGLTGLAGRLALPAMTLVEQAYARIKSGVRS